ncbi:uncharacterized protein DSM5745_10169 [Aspergillus mulundensis]|uniref:Short-chain dehydrogenase n=1 Tax=Aspergillus mulundensis TaxID=1810919 RepID=A0A3D8QMZ8_9EURO|nr:Uncharacterized protein DSM5745_10169 [Aspergillus mulundensis]RDW63058.1 Uncharacterized protein DSM5745_10169 [Aspergillus mulundensis]
MPAPIALILGSGPRIGSSVAATFAAKGYKVATASRSGSGNNTPEGILSLTADFADPSSIPRIFESVRATFGAAPAVVVYNAYRLTEPAEGAGVLSISADDFVRDLNVNTVSAYVAAQKAVEGWEALSAEEGVKKTFIYTGNALNTVVAPVAGWLDLGVGKSASAYWVGAADALYREKGYRFFYADERLDSGEAKGYEIDGPAHAEFFAQLASHEGEVPWLATFVKDKGYVKFDSSVLG